MKKFGTLSWSILIYVLLIVSSCSYFQELDQRRNKAISDLEAICKAIPITNDFTEINSRKTTDIEKVAIFKNYKTNSSCKDIGEHFRNYFVEKGWDPNRMKTIQRRGGLETLDFDFRDGEYLVSVECESAAAPNAEKEIGLSCSWGLGPSD